MPEASQGLRIATRTPQGVAVVFDTRIYRLDAIKKAAYNFGARCRALIEEADDHNVRVTLLLKDGSADSEVLAGDFCNECLDQELREVVGRETEAVRNLLLAHAFSKTSLINQEGETADYRSDPLQIAQPQDGSV
jgi:His-Xaa-Ser system protein HxsD